MLEHPVVCILMDANWLTKTTPDIYEFYYLSLKKHKLYIKHKLLSRSLSLPKHPMHTRADCHSFI